MVTARVDRRLTGAGNCGNGWRKGVQDSSEESTECCVKHLSTNNCLCVLSKHVAFTISHCQCHCNYCESCKLHCMQICWNGVTASILSWSNAQLVFLTFLLYSVLNMVLPTAKTIIICCWSQRTQLEQCPAFYYPSEPSLPFCLHSVYHQANMGICILFVAHCASPLAHHSSVGRASDCSNVPQKSEFKSECPSSWIDSEWW
jgi:hypothetical protein